MTDNKVPLVVYENGERKIIGEVSVEADGDHMNVTGKITDKDYASQIEQNFDSLSIGPFPARNLKDFRFMSLSLDSGRNAFGEGIPIKARIPLSEGVVFASNAEIKNHGEEKND